MINKLTLKEISSVARIHKEELSGFLPELGEEFLQAFYKNSLNIPEMFTFIDCENDHICGFATGIISPKGLYKKIIIQNKILFIILILRHLITHPFQIVKMVKILTYPGFSDDITELLTIAIPKSEQGRGRGKKLFKQIANNFQKKGINKFRISVYDRLPSNGFYKRIGCKLENSFEFLDEKMNYYSYNI